MTQPFLDASKAFHQHVVPLVCHMCDRVAVGRVKFEWIKNKSHDGAVRILDGRNLELVQCFKSLT